jgi:acyl-CoA dehydrogenase
MLGMAIPEEYGGAGIPDYRYNVVLQEEAARALVTLATVRTQLEVILPYFLYYVERRTAAALVSGSGRRHTADRGRDD